MSENAGTKYVVEVFDRCGLLLHKEAKDWTHCVQIYRGTVYAYPDEVVRVSCPDRVDLNEHGKCTDGLTEEEREEVYG